MSGRCIELAGVGAVRVQSSPRARRIRISICGPEAVRVVVPRGASLAHVKAFVESKKDWIARQVAVLRDTRLLEPSAILNPEHARAHLFARLETLSQLHGFAYAKAAVRSQKSRWGSCSPKNTISLNIRLYLLPPRLADYVILHELVHTRIKDHGPTFWKLLEARMTDAKARDRELRRFRLT